MKLIIFFIGLLLSALLTIFLSYKIHRASNTPAWKAFVLFGIFVVPGGALGLIRPFVSNQTITSLIYFGQSLSLLISLYFIITAINGLLKELNQELKLLNKKTILITTGIFFLGLIIYNFGQLGTLTGSKAYSIAAYTMSLGLLLLSGPASRLAFMTKKLPWIFMLLALIISAIGHVHL